MNYFFTFLENEESWDCVLAQFWFAQPNNNMIKPQVNFFMIKND